ncbi:hypothetical protein EDB85DRAFT_1986835, partial [Lactarius pseudohatsudake]
LFHKPFLDLALVAISVYPIKIATSLASGGNEISLSRQPTLCSRLQGGGFPTFWGDILGSHPTTPLNDYYFFFPRIHLTAYSEIREYEASTFGVFPYATRHTKSRLAEIRHEAEIL